MLGTTRYGKIVDCPNCKNHFHTQDAQRECSNCFACTGCEIYYCPLCNFEVVVKPKKTIGGNNA